jgi:hypothetical protein
VEIGIVSDIGEEYFYADVKTKDGELEYRQISLSKVIERENLVHGAYFKFDESGNVIFEKWTQEELDRAKEKAKKLACDIGWR